MISSFIIANVIIFQCVQAVRETRRYQSDNDRRIIGGTHAFIKNAPYLASLLLRVDRNSGGNHHTFICGSVIVGSYWSITTASCIEKIAEKLIKAGHLIVRSNTTSWIDLSTTKKDRAVSAFRKHELYKGFECGYDYNIAVVRVETPYTEADETFIDIANEAYQVSTKPHN
ncbi:hypothetical protein ILUMI_20686 [Ignelater luminosus]|uniref:Peptidase S1 domain-containing protein n=1 Tax=Ignelater luminosus TaxID=2038154 RepID=A0A8K0CK91_IGNLU|nr:hypothetical protein ILUMI_20686 [Ignelater luminosus]